MNNKIVIVRSFPVLSHLVHYKWAIVLVLSGSATGGGTDYTDLTGYVVVFYANDDTKACVVAITNDQLPEEHETFTVSIANPAGAVLGPAATATVTITDDNGE